MKINVYTLDVQLPRWLKRAIIFGGIPAVVLFGVAQYLRADVSIPNMFADGEQLSAAKMNANFKALQDAVNQTTPSGTVVAFAGPVVPAGWLLCDGSTVSRTTYPTLFAAIGIAHGAGDAVSTFALPDYRGRFLRGVDQGMGRDPEAPGRVASGAMGNAGDKIGSLEDDAFQGHWHRIYTSLSGGTGAINWNGAVDTFPTGSTLMGIIAKSPTNDGTNGEPRTSSETRPKNVYVNFIIKY